MRRFTFANTLHRRLIGSAKKIQGPWKPSRSVLATISLACAGMLAAGSVSATQGESQPQKIERIYLIHATHTDVGFTDHPMVCRDQQIRYLDVAIDAALATVERPPAERFYWTAEGTLAVNDWWQQASPERQKDLLAVLKTRQLEITALAMNQQATLNAQEWQKMTHWIPEVVWEVAQPKAAMQVDVTGIPRAGAIALLDRGVGNLWMASNTHLCREPFPRWRAFWWKMPDGRRLFVYAGVPYASGFDWFHNDGWRRGPVPEVASTAFRPPRPGETYPSDEAGVRRAHQRVVSRVKGLEDGGYDCPVLLLEDTNRWRMDNDPPAVHLADFVATWNRLKLKPELVFTTASPALEALKERVGDHIPEASGEWTEWWVNGIMSGPREVAASRLAKRKAAAAASNVWGPLDSGTHHALDRIYRNLCLFDEHTWGSADSVGKPAALATHGQYNEKARTAYLALALSKVLLAQRARTAVYGREEGFYVANTTDAPYTGWVEIPVQSLRGDVQSFVDVDARRGIPLFFEPGYGQFRAPSNSSEVTRENESQNCGDNFQNARARFWIDEVPPQTIRRLMPSGKKPASEPSPPASQMQVTTDELGWPTVAIWPGMKRPLFAEAPGQFFAMKMQGLSPRWLASGMIHIAGDEAKRKRQEELFQRIDAEPEGKAEQTQTAHTTVYQQYLKHSSCKWLVRELEIHHAQPRATLTLRFKRISNERPEVLCSVTTIPDDDLPLASNGSVPYRPYLDQLPNTCRDYFPIDGWLNYASEAGSWLWTTRDAPLVAFDRSHTYEGIDILPERPGLIVNILFDNTWMTNFVADQHGMMEFRYNLAWSPKQLTALEAEAWTSSLALEPPVVTNVEAREHPIYMERLHKP